MRKPAIRLLLSGVIILFVLITGSLIAFLLVNGRGTGLRSLPRNMVSVFRAVRDHQGIFHSISDKYTNVIFLHHSTGNNFIEQGGIRDLFSEAGYDFWDHGYNYQGLRDPQGIYRNYSYVVPRDNTDPDGLAAIFGQKVFSLPLNTLSSLLQYDVIITKSCFAPASHIMNDSQLEQYKVWYQNIRAVMKQHPDKLFVIMTQPPLNPAETNPDEALRARKFAEWLKSDEFLLGYSNVVTFDFYGYLAEEDPAAPDYNMLRGEYRDGSASHPNQAANETIAPIFVDFVTNAITNYQFNGNAK